MPADQGEEQDRRDGDEDVPAGDVPPEHEGRDGDEGEQGQGRDARAAVLLRPGPEEPRLVAALERDESDPHDRYKQADRDIRERPGDPVPDHQGHHGRHRRRGRVARDREAAVAVDERAGVGPPVAPIPSVTNGERRAGSTTTDRSGCGCRVQSPVTTGDGDRRGQGQITVPGRADRHPVVPPRSHAPCRASDGSPRRSDYRTARERGGARTRNSGGECHPECASTRRVRALSSNRTGPSRPVDLLLSLEPALADDVHHGVDGVAHQEGQLLTFGHREVPEHEVGGVLPPRRTPDPHPQAAVLLRPQRPADRPEPVVAALAAAPLEHEIAEREVELVVDDEQPLRLDLEEAAGGGDLPAGLVHVRRRDGEHEALPRSAAGRRQSRLCDLRPGAVRGEPHPEVRRELRHDHRTDVVPVARVLGARVAQPDDEPGPEPLGVLGHRGTPSSWNGTGPRFPSGPCRCGSTCRSVSRGCCQPSPAVSPAGSSTTSPSGAPWSAVSAAPPVAMMTTVASGSVIRVEPSGRAICPAWIWVPSSAPSTDTAIACGMAVASTSSDRVVSSSVVRPFPAGSPVTCTGTSTVTFSPRRTRTRSTCSISPRTGLRCTSLGRASCVVPLPRSSVSSVLECLSASIVAWPGSATCTGSEPCP